MIKPMGNWILVKRHENQKITSGGVYIPDNFKTKSMEGTVLAVGFGEWVDGERYQFSVKEGDRVAFGRLVGDEITVDGEEVIFMKEDELIGVLK